MTFHKSQSTGRLRLHHLQEQTEAVGEDMEQERKRKRFAAFANRDATRAVSSFNLFQTPVDLAARLAEMLSELDGKRILEPSAGLGRLYRAIRNRSDGCHITMVEQSPACCAELYRETEQDDACRLIQGDFLTCDAERLGGLFDCVLMNPPFKMGRDVKHIHHALTLLKEGGLLVSLCFAGVKQRAAFYEDPGWTWYDLPPGTFKSEGTRADAAIVCRENRI